MNANNIQNRIITIAADYASFVGLSSDWIHNISIAEYAELRKQAVWEEKEHISFDISPKSSFEKKEDYHSLLTRPEKSTALPDERNITDIPLKNTTMVKEEAPVSESVSVSKECPITPAHEQRNGFFSVVDDNFIKKPISNDELDEETKILLSINEEE